MSVTHEVRTGPLNNRSTFTLRVGAEEDGRPKDSLKRCDQTAILGAALLHGKRVEHLGSAIKCDPGSLLSDREGRKENWNQAILPPGESVARMPGDLQNELAVPALVQEATGCRPFDWEAAKDKRAGREAEVLPGGFALESDALDGLDPAHSPLGDNEAWMGIR